MIETAGLGLAGERFGDAGGDTEKVLRLLVTANDSIFRPS